MSNVGINRASLCIWFSNTLLLPMLTSLSPIWPTSWAVYSTDAIDCACDMTKICSNSLSILLLSGSALPRVPQNLHAFCCNLHRRKRLSINNFKYKACFSVLQWITISSAYRSTGFRRFHHYYELIRPYRLVPSLHVCVLCSWQNDGRFSCSVQKPVYSSCQLCPGCPVTGNQVVCYSLSQRKPLLLAFDIF